jgi:hypothetical protein
MNFYIYSVSTIIRLEYDTYTLTSDDLKPLIQLEEPESRSIPYQRYGHTAVTYDENAFIWGGRNDKDGACNVLYGFSSSKYLIV